MQQVQWNAPVSPSSPSLHASNTHKHMHHHFTHADSGDTEDDLIAVKIYNMLPKSASELSYYSFRIMNDAPPETVSCTNYL